MKHITPENLCDFAFVNEDTLTYPVKGVCTCFHGYTDSSFMTESHAFARMLGERGIIFVFPYYSVWAWFSDNSLELIEQVIDAVYEKYNLNPETPLCVSGGSMGGMTALLYPVYGRRKPVCVAADCPVSDMRRFYETHPRDRRSVMDAHINKDKPMEQILFDLSPICLVDRMPKIPYYLAYGTSDRGITKEIYEPFCEAMQKAGHNFTADIVDGMGHCELINFKSNLRQYVDFIEENIIKERGSASALD